MWENIVFKVIFVAENSNKFKKSKFWKEKLVEDMVTLEDLPFNSSMISFHIGLFKKSIHTLQNNVHMLSSLICNRFTLGPMAHATRVCMKKELSKFCNL